ncbi:hypothetical protein ASC83_22565 [Acidovorax sp. Root402]|nr:hypothetical protein ASC83_22565 [Acidovorax sp. Root402]
MAWELAVDVEKSIEYSKVLALLRKVADKGVRDEAAHCSVGIHLAADISWMGFWRADLGMRELNRRQRCCAGDKLTT